MSVCMCMHTYIQVFVGNLHSVVLLSKCNKELKISLLLLKKGEGKDKGHLFRVLGIEMLQTSLSLGPVVRDGGAPLSLATLPSPFLCRLRYPFLTARLTGEVSCITQVLSLCTSQSRCQHSNHSAVRFSTFVTDVQLKQKNCKTLFMPDTDWVNKDVMTWK